ncbi:hypothetical protein [Phenylobacterium montanum]|uniref:Uncharacterized protein n=1 Tax=Phenylobacterium montanum TaxID=2823693 RepID=A0A975IVF2_9CAUL|nr:hypothetical protein [Caulobacter sp. S6]QUD87256.1 hypothetical protein KCG34_19715 [Caulobacter sp. S6]
MAALKFKPILSGAAVGALVAVLAGCATPPPPPAPPAPLPPAPAPADLTLSPAIIQSAAAYQAFIARSTAIKPDFANGDDVEHRLQTGESFDPAIMTRGEIAFAAVVALQEPTFVAEIRNYSMNESARAELARTIAADPNYATGFRGANAAAGLIIAAMTTQGQGLQDEGEAVRLSAYGVQRQEWSKVFVPDLAGRLSLAKTTSANVPTASTEDAERERQAAIGYAPLLLPVHAPAASPPYPPAVVRGLAIAALALLGHAGEADAAITEPMFADPPDQTCLNMAKLNLYQCLAVAKPYYEDIFCLGQHAMKDTGQCLRMAAGAPPPAVEFIPPTQSAKTPVKPVKKRRKKGD